MSERPHHEDGPWAGYQSRYVAYCKIHGAATPEAMLERDEAKYPGGCMGGYILWIGRQWHEWDGLTQHNGPRLPEDHEEFDRWLDQKAALVAAPDPSPVPSPFPPSPERTEP